MTARSTTELFNVTAMPYDDDYGTMDYSDISEPCVYSSPATYFIPVLYSLLFLVGLLGNVLVVWVLVAGAQLRSMTDICLLHLAAADLLLLCSLPFLAHQARERWDIRDTMCKMVLGTYYVGYYSGIFFIVLMSVDRYLAIVHAVYALKARTRTFGVLAGLVTWTAAFLASLPEVTFLKVHSVNGTEHYCAPSYGNHGPGEPEDDARHWWWIFSLFKMNILGLVIPLVIMTFCYCQIIRTLLLRKSSKKATIRLIVGVVAVFFCCWLPFNIMCFFKALELMDIYASCASSQHIQLGWQVTEVMAYSHSCINPMLYVFVGEKFRRNLYKLMLRSPCMRCPGLWRCIPSQNRLRGSIFSQSTNVSERSTVQ